MIDWRDVMYINRLYSTLPARWRLYIRGGTFSNPVLESGQYIIQKIEDGIPPADVIDKINYLDVEYEEDPLSVLEILTITAPLVNELEKLDPKLLEKKFQSYSFSQTYKTTPTELDSLAVRFSSVYRKEGYNVPEIPDDFFERFDKLEDPVQGNKNEYNCVICMQWTKTHVFPTCKHFCVCERCSYTILKCPLCRKVGNPQKVFL